jgi:serine/threonine-protein kinase
LRVQGIPDDLERVILRCLAKEPAARFLDAQTLQRALNGCACASGWDAEKAAAWWAARKETANPATQSSATPTCVTIRLRPGTDAAQ